VQRTLSLAARNALPVSSNRSAFWRASSAKTTVSIPTLTATSRMLRANPPEARCKPTGLDFGLRRHDFRQCGPPVDLPRIAASSSAIMGMINPASSAKRWRLRTPRPSPLAFQTSTVAAIQANAATPSKRRPTLVVTGAWTPRFSNESRTAISDSPNPGIARAAQACGIVADRLRAAGRGGAPGFPDAGSPPGSRNGSREATRCACAGFAVDDVNSLPTPFRQGRKPCRPATAENALRSAVNAPSRQAKHMATMLPFDRQPEAVSEPVESVVGMGNQTSGRSASIQRSRSATCPRNASPHQNRMERSPMCGLSHTFLRPSRPVRFSQ